MPKTIIEQLEELSRAKYTEEPKSKSTKPVMWKALIYQMDDLILDHSQNDFNKVFRFTMNALAELHQNNVKDYRVTIQDKDGNLYFFSIGEKTELVSFKKGR